MKKIMVAIIFGGRSAEHEVSIQSAKNIFNSLDKDKYEPILIGIDKTGKWVLNQPAQLLLSASNPKLTKLNKTSKEVSLVQKNRSTKLVSVTDNQDVGSVDVVFPVLHGPFGEDGTIQGMLKLLNIPFVGSSVLGSALGMDKDAMKRLLNHAGIPTAKFLCFQKGNKINFATAKTKLGLPFFVKPANLGSSVGISKVKNEKEFKKAVRSAFEFDSKILVEEYVKGREIECSVLGNENPIASIPGEVVPTHEFYSYEAKYVDENGAILKVPANLPKKIVKTVQELAIKTFKTLCCEGMARVDFFLKENGDVVVNELNTIPGFTKISMYPKLWEASGISYQQLVDRLIQLALERFKRESKLKTSI
ncbi:D-alanine--D-alanine ligase [Candidatus Microgenomates bacterium]|nr:D-alanine--D-alanine ligase [Candidatus Microgenomates bacterium]